MSNSKKEVIPRKTVVFSGDMDYEPVKALIDEIESYAAVDLHFSSRGGYVSYGKILSACINKHEDIVLYPFDSIGSSAADLVFVDCQCPVIITEIMDFVTFHGQDRELYDNRTSYYDSKAFRTIDRKVNKKSVKNYGFMTEEQISDYLGGKDIIIYQTDFKVFRGFKDNIKVKL